MFHIRIIAAIHLSTTTMIHCWALCGSFKVLGAPLQVCIMIPQGRKTDATSKTKFSTCTFFANLVQFLEDARLCKKRKAAIFKQAHNRCFDAMCLLVWLLLHSTQAVRSTYA